MLAKFYDKATFQNHLRKHCLSQHENIKETKNLEPNTTQKLVSSSITISKEKEQEQVSQRKIRRGQWIVRLKRLKPSDFI